MSLAALVLRVATVYALKGATIAGDLVLDAPLDPLDDALASKKPAIAVFTGTEDGTIHGKDLIGGDLSGELVIQAYLPDGVRVTVGGQILEIDTRGSGAELALQILERQILATLQGGAGPWPELWRTFAMSIKQASTQPFLLQTGGTDNVIRIAAREISLQIETLSDPMPGVEPVGAWLDALNLMGTEPALAPLVVWLREAAVSPAGLTDRQWIGAELGLVEAEVRAIGIAPAVDEEGLAIISGATAALEDGSELVADRATIEENLP